MRKKMLAVLLVLMMLVTACAASSAEEALSGSLVYYSSWNPTESQALVLTDAADAFMEANPGVTIEFFFSGRDLNKTLRTLVETGTKIDMFDMNADTIMSTYPDIAQPLNEFLTKAYPSTDGKPYEECVMTAFIDLAKKLGDGDVLYCPYIPQSQMFFYNGDIFEAVGVNPPETWTEFLDVCEKIKAAGYIPLTEDSTRQLSMLGYHLNRLKGRDFVLELVADTGLWRDEAVVRTLNDYKELADKGYFADNVLTNQNPAAMQEMVLGGQIAMFLNGTWMPNETNASNPDFNWGAFAYPTVEGGVDDNTCTAFGSYGITLTPTCESPKAAFAFAAFITTGEWDQAMSSRTQSIPMAKDAEWPTALLDVQKVLNATTQRYNAHLEVRVNTDLQPIIASAFTELIGGVITPEQFIETVQK